jgi:hypothetical protein
VMKVTGQLTAASMRAATRGLASTATPGRGIRSLSASSGLAAPCRGKDAAGPLTTLVIAPPK